MDTELKTQRDALVRALLRLAVLLAVVATALALAGCGGGQLPECAEHHLVADGKKAIPAEPCGDEAF